MKGDRNRGRLSFCQIAKDPNGEHLFSSKGREFPNRGSPRTRFFGSLFSLLITTVLAVIGKYAAPYPQEWIFHLISTLVSFFVISALSAMMFKWLPDVIINWYDVWLGAVLTALLFELGKSAIDGKVIAEPVIREPITGGSLQVDLGDESEKSEQFGRAIIQTGG